MFNKDFLASLVFIDIETVPGAKSINDMDLSIRDLWSKRCEYLRDRFDDNSEKSDDELWSYKAALHAEFNKIICVSFGRYVIKEDEIKFNVKSVAGDDEYKVVAGALSFIDKLAQAINGFKLCGHNVKRFDFPVIGKRALINGLKLPNCMVVYDKKPWEIPLFDTMDLWSFGAWQEGFTSLDLITTVLGIPSPKDDINGSDVGKVYWQDNDLPRIVKYCEKDVIALAQILLKLGEFPLIEEEKISIL